MFAATAILSCVIKIRGLFKSAKCRHFKMSNLKLSRPGVNHILNRFYGISREGPVSMEQVLKNADISVFSNFLEFFSNFFLYIDKFYQVLSTCQISDQLDNLNRNYRGGESAPPS